MLSREGCPFLQIAYEFFELLDSQSSANEDLHAARVADKIRLSVACPFVDPAVCRTNMEELPFCRPPLTLTFASPLEKLFYL